MSRTTLCVLTAALLACLSAGISIVRCRVLGDEVKLPTGPGTWKVTMLIHGKMTGSDAKLLLSVPPDFGHQHIVHEMYRSTELLARPRDPKRPERRLVSWSQRPGIPEGPFRARYEFYGMVDVRQPSTPMSKLAKDLYATPQGGNYLKSEAGIESDDPEISALARNLTTGIERFQDQVEALFRYVELEIGNDPKMNGIGMSAVECLKTGSGDSRGKSRLLAALCRNRGIPTRLVTGLTLKKGHEQSAHLWTEAWINDHWLPMCPFYRYFGRVPPTFFIMQFGDQALVRGRGLRDLDYGFLVERTVSDEESVAATSPLRRALLRLSLYALPPAEQKLVEFLLLLPVAALIVCIFRNLIGVHSFGTFAPALVGLAFRDLGSLPGILVFVSIVLVGWIMRRVLDHYHLLQVPRTAFLLSLVVILLIAAIVAANYQDLPATKYISLFPMVILTGMIERFWTLEVEDTTSASFRTLLATMMIAASISLFLSLHAVLRHMFRFPETLGLIMAAQLLIGRYTGYRLLELLRFRDFLRQEPAMSSS